MQSPRSLRRLALGAAIVGSAVGAAPALASASTCSYVPSTHQVFSVDNSGAGQLTVTRSGLNNIAVGWPGTPPQVCMSDSEFDAPVAATVTNTDKIVVGAQGPLLVGPSDGFIIDERSGVLGPGFTPEGDGNSEIEVEVHTDQLARLTVLGTEDADVIRIGRRPEGLHAVNFGPDTDIDARLTGGNTRFVINGLGGDDTVTATGNPIESTLTPSKVPVDLYGGAGRDILGGSGSLFGGDHLVGGASDDFLESDHSPADTVDGGSGFDTALTDASDTPTGIEKQEVREIGRLRLARHLLRARAGKTSHLRMSWTHPKAWRELRAVEVRLYDGAKPVGMINVRPRGERLTADGAISLAAGSRVTHHGKTVSAKLAFRLPRSLAGHSLRIAVQATDRRGHEQLEPDAGTIRVAK